MTHALVPASYVLLLRGPLGEEEILLHLRQNTGYRDGHWAMIAGHVDADESARTAAQREAYEEVGVSIPPDALEPLTTLHRWVQGGPALEQRVDFFWTARTWDGDPRIVEPEKASDQRWFSLRDLPQPGVEHELVVIEAYLRGPVPPILTLTSHVTR
ncbi:NUDIX domain-containing protein [Mumia zhuanghuii]|uniref:NUDIX domain-containing protein n=1 Tax=Mumia zhuanghuii TaxID=2585211 RepID=A0A5C4M1X6_9ACTN|nr:NUDIX domain-containing protein [Mumia zhuanghuii]TNC26835.1 NUDIX domain-containing protein [Mumia zhuanghuii]